MKGTGPIPGLAGRLSVGIRTNKLTDSRVGDAVEVDSEGNNSGARCLSGDVECHCGDAVKEGQFSAEALPLCNSQEEQSHQREGDHEERTTAEAVDGEECGSSSAGVKEILLVSSKHSGVISGLSGSRDPVESTCTQGAWSANAEESCQAAEEAAGDSPKPSVAPRAAISSKPASLRRKKEVSQTRKASSVERPREAHRKIVAE